LAREFAGFMGGEVFQAPGAQGGSIFSLRLPLLPAGEGDHEQPGDVDSGTKEAFGIEMPRVLLVEDDEHLRCELKRQLSAYYTVHAVGDGLAALRVLEQGLPEVVVSDIRMPGMDGLTLLKKVHDHPLGRGIPFLFVTAMVQEEQVVAGLASGAVAYITKPVAFNRLKLKIDNLLSLEKGLEEQFRRRIDDFFTREASVAGLSFKRSLTEVIREYELSRREGEVLQCFADGMTEDEILEALSISVNTLKTHKRNIFKKLGVAKRIELQNRLEREGIV
ncbi:MAG: response regulator transcription factor, partial [Okeania sp. SIO3B3]|nr:response regulator transcription factor [Okeania sp. SIO3B3]